MKKQLLMVFVICYAFAKAAVAKTTTFTVEDVAGTYKKGGEVININIAPKTSIITWLLNLTPDGRFEYHNFRQLEGQEEDINDKYTINLDTTKARFFKKSKRNKSPEKQPTYIRFFESDYRITQNLKLFKTND